MSKLWDIVREPVSAEMRALLAARWQELPAELRTDWQVVGRHLTHCGYTMGPAYCSFGCTHCYLPTNANQAPLPSLEEMKAQIDANRRLQGPGGGLQITGGDVVDAYFRAGRSDELVAVVRYANDIGLVPMVMTHGQLLLEHPGFLAALVRHGGLRKLAIHIDITMAGRRGYPLSALRREADLDPLREDFVELILGVRRRTGVRFFAAQTVTVSERNRASLRDILHWFKADRRHLEAFRLVSFQTEAEVGRTRFSSRPVTAEEVWAEVCAGVGLDLSRDNLWFGDPACSNMTSLLVTFPEGRVIDLIPADPRSRALWAELLQVLGGVGGRGESSGEALLRKLAVLARHPGFLRRLAAYARHRLRAEGLGAGLLWQAARGRVGGFNVVLHNFMSERQLAAGGEEVEKRLRACSFRGAVRQGDDWVAVPMCEMNVRQREELYARQIAAS